MQIISIISPDGVIIRNMTICTINLLRLTLKVFIEIDQLKWWNRNRKVHKETGTSILLLSIRNFFTNESKEDFLFSNQKCANRCINRRIDLWGKKIRKITLKGKITYFVVYYNKLMYTRITVFDHQVLPN